MSMESEKSADEKRIERMDKVAETLLDLVENEGTSAMQKGRLFSQVLTWYKVREELVPSEEGDKLKEMGNAIKSKSGKRGRNPGREPYRSKDGAAIRQIIGSLPSYGGVAGGDQAGAKRSGRGAHGDAGGARSNGGGDGAGNDDGAADCTVV